MQGCSVHRNIRTFYKLFPLCAALSVSKRRKTHIISRDFTQRVLRQFGSQESEVLVPQKLLTITTRGQGLYEFTEEAKAFVKSSSAKEGLLTLFVRHTSCSLLVQENADPDVQRDLKTFFARLVPPSNDPSMAWVIHTMEGPDDMPAHIKSALTQVSIGIPVSSGTLALGTWQGIYLFEHRNHPHDRQIIMHLSL